MKAVVILLVVSVLIFSYGNLSANQQILFRHLTAQDGLAQNTVWAIHQDRSGYMWFATENGISRYDGYEFRNYYFNPHTAEGLSNQKVFVILEDRGGILWFGTNKGLNRYDPVTEQFKHYFAGDSVGSIAGDSVLALAEIGDELWVGTYTGISILDLNTGKSRKIEIGGSFDREIWSIAQDEDGGMWLAAMSGGVWHRKDGHEEWQSYWLSEDSKAYVNSVRCVLADGDWVWLGTKWGLARLSRSSGEVELINIDINSDKVADIFDLLKYNGQLWIASDGRGLYRFDIASGNIERYTQSAQDSYSVSSNRLIDLYRDKQNRLWLGSFAGGVNYDNLERSVFFYRHVPEDINSLPGKNVSSLVEVDNKLMFATADGISVYEQNSGLYHHHELNEIITLYIGPYGEHWASGQDGVFKLNDTGFKRIQTKKLGYTIALLQLSPDTILLGKFDSLWLWNETTQQLQEIELPRSNDKSFSESAAVEYLFRRANGDVLIATQAGIYMLDINNYQVSSSVGALQQLDGKHITYIYEDSHQHLWVSTDGDGLFNLNESGIVAQYSRANGMPDNAVRGIVESNGDIWVSTDRGIVSIKEQHQHKRRIVRYRQRFLSDEFNSGAVYRMRNGQLLFGGVFGAIRFLPEHIYGAAKSLPLAITDIRLFNQTLVGDSDAFSISDGVQRQLTLRHDQNIFSLDFSAFDYDQQGLVYAYRLSGVQGAEWILSDDRNRRATFTDLSAGDYVFEVKAGLNGYDWGDQIASMKITILPPWWQNPLAYAIYVLLMIGSILSYIRLRTHHLKKRAVQLERIVDERTQEVQTQHKTIERLLDKKNEMFANISHELRTPITLIAGPVDQVLSHPEEKDQTDMLRLAQRNIKRLNILVDQLLQLSRLYYLSDEQKIPQCISRITNAITISFGSITHLKQIHLESNILPDIWVKAIPNAMDTLLINLLSNAFKYTEANGKISVVLAECEGVIKLAVQDTGIGIPKEHYEDIFERFTRLDSSLEDKPEGVGVGLALVKQLLELHEGSIHIDSVEGKGSCFEVTLPSIQAPATLVEEPVISDTNSRQLSDIAELYMQRSVSPEKLVSNQPTTTQDASSKPSLLIIDDIQDMRDYLYRVLSDEFECILASSGKQGLELVVESMPDIVLCDVMMPGMDGFEVLDSMRDDMRSSHIPILMLTAKGDRESKIKGWVKLADDYIVKPFDAEELRARLGAVLEIRRLQQQQLNQVLHTKGLQDESLRGISKRDQDFLEKLHDVLQNHFDDPEFKLEQLAERIHLGARAIQIKTKALLGKSPKQYLREYRLTRAMEILRDEKLTTGELSGLVGFSSDAYFITCFKAYTGQTPSEYRQQFIIQKL